MGKKRQKRMDSMLVKNVASLSQKSSSQSYNHLSQQLHVNQRQKSWSGHSQSNISRQINNNGGDFVSIDPYINSGNGHEKLSSLDGVILQDLGLDDRLEPAFFGAQYNELFACKSLEAAENGQMVYCLPGQPNFYAIIPSMPVDIR